MVVCHPGYINSELYILQFMDEDNSIYFNTYTYKTQTFCSPDIIKTNFQENFFTSFCLINALENKCSPFPAIKQFYCYSQHPKFLTNSFLVCLLTSDPNTRVSCVCCQTHFVRQICLKCHKKFFS